MSNTVHNTQLGIPQVIEEGIEEIIAVWQECVVTVQWPIDWHRIGLQATMCG